LITHLLDTDVCIFALKRRSKLLEKLVVFNGHLAISDVTLLELYYGAAKYEEPQTRVDQIEDLAARLEVLPFNSQAARHAGEIRAVLERKGQVIGAYDLQIAGIARASGLTLATGNVREFSRVAGLLVENWAR
jgi:tRNA(fMet)-specific endonuclease VapC